MKRAKQNSSAKQWLTTEESSRRLAANAWLASLKHSWRQAFTFDYSQLTAFQAIRGTLGFVLPLTIGVATGHIVEGVSLAGGAATIGTVGIANTDYVRIRVLLFACLAIAISAFVGSITGSIAWLSVLVACLWGIGAGILVALGQSATIIGLQATVALIILTHFQLDPLHAALQALLMLAGALLQVLLALIPSPWRRTTPERTILTKVYRQLANYALDSRKEENGRRLTDALVKAGSLLADTNHRTRKGKIFLALFEETERIRLSILILTRLRPNLDKQGDATTYLDHFLQAVSDELQNIADELTPKYAILKFIGRPEQMKQTLTTLRQTPVAPEYKDVLQQILSYSDFLRQQLRVAKKLAKAWKYPRQPLALQLHVPHRSRLRLQDAWSTLQANFSLRSTAFRHAIRLGVTLGLATALYRVFPLPLQRGYWIPLSALFVLKPEFGLTFSRGVARVLGTMLGAALTTLLVFLLGPSKEVLVLLDALVTYLAFSLLFVNYGIFSAFITVETVLLLSFVTSQPLETTAYRAIDTLVGGVLALLIYALWPTWESSQVPGTIANRLEAIRHYFVAVMNAYIDPKTYDESTIYRYQRASRLSRSNAEASVRRSLQEPEPHRIDADLAQGLLAAADGIAQSILALEAYLIDNPTHHALPELNAFRQCIDEVLQQLINAATTGRLTAPLPDLQRSLRALERSSKLADDEGQRNRRFVLAEAKRIIRSTRGLHELLYGISAQEPATRTAPSRTTQAIGV